METTKPRRKRRRKPGTLRTMSAITWAAILTAEELLASRMIRSYGSGRRTVSHS